MVEIANALGILAIGAAIWGLYKLYKIEKEIKDEEI